MGYEIIALDGIKIDKATKKFPVEVTSEPHALNSAAHTGILDVSQLPVSVMFKPDHSSDPHTMMIDGRDVSADGTKLDTIESGAQVNNISTQQANSLTSGAHSSWHHHDDWYYRKSEISTSGLSSIHWDNLTNKPLTFSPSSHTHDDRYYTETEIDSIIAGIESFGIKGGVDTFADLPLSPIEGDIYIVRTTVSENEEGFYKYDSGSWVFLANNTGSEIHDHNNLYYTKTEIDTNHYDKTTVDGLILSQSQKSELTSGIDTTLHIHDSRYYTESEVDGFLSLKSDITHNHDTRYYTQTEVDTLYQTINTKIDSLTLDIISSQDPNTDITSAELELLTNGSMIDTLHTHEEGGGSGTGSGGLDEAYDNHSQWSKGGGREINVDFGSVTLNPSGGFAPLKLVQTTQAPTQWLNGGELTVQDNELYLYDPQRGKWLSVSQLTWGAGTNSNNVKDSYLKGFNGTNHNSNTGFVAPWDGTIVAMSASSDSETTVGIRTKNNGVDTSAAIWYSGGKSVYVTNFNVDFSAGDILSLYVEGSDNRCDRPQCWVFVKRRI